MTVDSNLQIYNLSLLVNPRGKRTALIQASVPEFTNLILSILGTIDTAKAAICVSSSWAYQSSQLSFLDYGPPVQST
jgi:hypothetical protein